MTPCRYGALARTPADARLRAMPTFFTGHMSGVNWLPDWTLDPQTPHGRFRTYAGGKDNPYGIADFYTEPLLRAQRLHVRTVGQRYREHPALYAWDLGNEFSNMREPTSPQDAAIWSATLAHDLLETSDVGTTAGTHGEDITRDRHLRLSSLCAPFDFATMHGYSVYSSFARNRLDAEVVPFLDEIAASCARKRVLFTEFGNPTCPPATVSPYDRVPLPGEAPIASSTPPSHAAAFACLTEDEMCTYAHDVLDRLQQRGALGAFWWCWADYANELSELPPFDNAAHELTFGIVRNDGSEKPVARTLQAFAAETREVVAQQPAIVEEAAYYAGLPDNLDATYREYVASR